MQVSDKDLFVFADECVSQRCSKSDACDDAKCRLCKHCLADDELDFLRTAYLVIDLIGMPCVKSMCLLSAEIKILFTVGWGYETNFCKFITLFDSRMDKYKFYNNIELTNLPAIGTVYWIQHFME